MPELAPAPPGRSWISRSQPEWAALMEGPPVRRLGMTRGYFFRAAIHAVVSAIPPAR